jgi:quercetin dioxygenase-like cupin family protein
MATAQKHTYLRTHQISGTGFVADLSREAAALAAKASTAASGRAAKTLVKNGPLRATLVAMRKGAAMRKHHVDGPATIHVLRGRARITTPRGRIDLTAGRVLALGAAVEHAHQALSDCVVLLTFID